MNGERMENDSEEEESEDGDDTEDDEEVSAEDGAKTSQEESRTTSRVKISPKRCRWSTIQSWAFWSWKSFYFNVIQQALEDEQESEESQEGEEEGNESDLVSPKHSLISLNIITHVYRDNCGYFAWILSTEFWVQLEEEMEKEGEGRSCLAATIEETQEEIKSKVWRTVWYSNSFNLVI